MNAKTFERFDLAASRVDATKVTSKPSLEYSFAIDSIGEYPASVNTNLVKVYTGACLRARAR